MRVLVTGGRGFLGRYVCDALVAEGDEVVAFGSRDYDLRHDSIALVQETKPDAVVHLAARVGGVGDNVAAPGTFLYDNAIMGLQLMEAAQVGGVEKFLTVGTACMYPANLEFMSEDRLWDGEPAHDTKAYAHAKRLILAQGQAYADQYDFNAVFVIPSNLYGPGDRSTHVVPMMARKFLDAQANDEPVVLWGTGQATRDFLYVKDAAEGVADALHYYNDPAPVNLGTGVATPIFALAHAMAWEIEFKGDIMWDPTRPEGTLRRMMDTSRAHNRFGWNAKTTLRQGLPRYLEWLKGTK